MATAAVRTTKNACTIEGFVVAPTGIERGCFVARSPAQARGFSRIPDFRGDGYFDSRRFPAKNGKELTNF
jgi:hypothetical protein